MALCLNCKHSDRSNYEQLTETLFAWCFTCPVANQDEHSMYGPSEKNKVIIMTEIDAWEDAAGSIFECKFYETAY